MPSKVAAYCLTFRDTSVGQPFRAGVDVYKVSGKIFAIVAPDRERPTVALKCHPEIAVHLREKYPAVLPGYHLNKTHWNTVVLDGTVPAAEVKKMIALSYELVVSGLPKTARDRLARKTTGRRSSRLRT